MSVEAAYWTPLPDGAVRCELCPLRCRLVAGRDGPCGSRGNVGGRLITRQYGRLVSAAVDPIEKKPLFHFHPGAPILSIAALGCNLHCQFCQNWTISQGRERVADSGGTREAAPADIVALARAHRSLGVAYTYSEPLVWFEFVRDTARLMRQTGLKNVIVSNGFLNEAPLRELLPLLDAANIDLKSMDDGFYRKVCKAKLQPVLAAIRLCRELGVHLEITNLVIPGYNDSDEAIAQLVAFVAELGRDVPLHFSAYHPAYRFKAPPTPPATLARAAQQARQRLDYVYVGNVWIEGGADTRCPACGAVAIRRAGYETHCLLGPGATCPECGTSLPIIGV